jgi:hypothetical protein
MDYFRNFRYERKQIVHPNKAIQVLNNALGLKAPAVRFDVVSDQLLASTMSLLLTFTNVNHFRSQVASFVGNNTGSVHILVNLLDKCHSESVVVDH